MGDVRRLTARNILPLFLLVLSRVAANNYLGTIHTSQFGSGDYLALSDGLLFYIDWPPGVALNATVVLKVVNVTDPSFAQVGTYELLRPDNGIAENYFGASLVVEGKSCYVVYENFMSVLDVSNPARIKAVSNMVLSKRGIGVSVRGDYLFVSKELSGFPGGILVYDRSGTGDPVLVGDAESPFLGNFFSVQFSGDKVYAPVDGSAVCEFDVSNVHDPKYVGAFETDSMRALSVVSPSGGPPIAFVGDLLELYAVSLKNVTEGKRMDSLNMQGRNLVSSRHDGDFVYVLRVGVGLETIFADPENLSVLHTTSAPVPSNCLLHVASALDRGILCFGYVGCNGSGGIIVLDVTHPETDLPTTRVPSTTSESSTTPASRTQVPAPADSWVANNQWIFALAAGLVFTVVSVCGFIGFRVHQRGRDAEQQADSSEVLELSDSAAFHRLPEQVQDSAA